MKIAGRSIPAVAGRGGRRVDTAASVTRREGWTRRLPLLPAFVYVFLMTQIPFVLTIYYSFFSWNLLKPGSFRFSGLDNYSMLLTDESVRTAVLNTVVLTVCVIGISVVFGMGVAMLLNSEIFGKGLMRTCQIFDHRHADHLIVSIVREIERLNTALAKAHSFAAGETLLCFAHHLWRKIHSFKSSAAS